MNIRKDPLENNCIYHIFSRSIAKYVVFNTLRDYQRMIEMFSLYRFTDFNYCFSKYKSFTKLYQKQLLCSISKSNNELVDIIAFCLMPTHFHFILKQNTQEGISKFISRVLNSYTRYFNVQHKRVGPLWEGKFKNVLVKTDEQLLHLTRYIHLNPTTANLVDSPEKWNFSSYNNYIANDKQNLLQEYFNLNSKQYKDFVDERISYQKQLKQIKSLLID